MLRRYRAIAAAALCLLALSGFGKPPFIKSHALSHNASRRQTHNSERVRHASRRTGNAQHKTRALRAELAHGRSRSTLDEQIYSQGFEHQWPPEGWSVGDDNNNGDHDHDYWGRVNCAVGVHGGSYGAWCAGEHTDDNDPGNICQHYYHCMGAYMITAPIDIAGYTNVVLSYWWRVNLSHAHRFKVYWSEDGSNWILRHNTNDNHLWTLTQDTIPAEWGWTTLYVKWYFWTDDGSDWNHPGAYVDDFRVNGDLNPTITVTYPNGGETLYAGDEETFSWDSENLDGNVTIAWNPNYPDANGWQVIVQNVEDLGEYDWTFPEQPTSTARIRVSGGNAGQINDISDGNFTIACYPDVEVDDPLDFGDVIMGACSTLTERVQNHSCSNLVIHSLTLSSGFRTTSQCPQTVVPNGFLDIPVTFCPLVQEDYEGTLELGVDGADEPVIVSLYGSGIADCPPEINVSDERLDFEDTQVGACSNQTLTIENWGCDPLIISAVTATDSFRTNFTQQVTLQQDSSFNLTVRFCPAVVQLYTGTLTISSNDPSSPTTVELTGTGMSCDPILTILSRDEIDFGEMRAGVCSPPETLFVRNTGCGNLTISAVEAPDGFTTNFRDTLNISAGDSVSLAIRFCPAVDEEYYDYLVISSNDPEGEYDVAVSGTGVASAAHTAKDLLPTVTQLKGNYPNPFNPTTTIGYDLSTAGHARLVIYDVLGRLAATLVDQTLAPGFYRAEWNASAMPSGVYLARFEAPGCVMVKKLMLVK